MGLIHGSGRYPGVGNGNLLQYSCLENSMHRGAPVGYSPPDHRVGHNRESTHAWSGAPRIVGIEQSRLLSLLICFKLLILSQQEPREKQVKVNQKKQGCQPETEILPAKQPRPHCGSLHGAAVPSPPPPGQPPGHTQAIRTQTCSQLQTREKCK